MFSFSASSLKLSLWSLLDVEVLDPLLSELASAAVRLRTNPEFAVFIFSSFSLTKFLLFTFHYFRMQQAQPKYHQIMHGDLVGGCKSLI